jgi:opacity protein-like surface antigen
MRRFVAFLFVAVLLAAAPASAQDKKVDVNVGGGYTFALSEVSKHLGNGYNINFGVTVNVTPVIGIQFEYSYNGLGQKQINLPVAAQPIVGGVSTPFFADMNMQYGDANLVFKPKMEGKVRPYLSAGGGIYYRPVKVTTPGVGFVPGYCDPFWYYCSPGGFVPVTNIVGSRSSTDFGIDIGGGVNVRVGEKASVYVEARYHFIWGPEFGASVQPLATATGTSGKANGQFLPITVGLRF